MKYSDFHSKNYEEISDAELEWLRDNSFINNWIYYYISATRTGYKDIGNYKLDNYKDKIYKTNQIEHFNEFIEVLKKLIVSNEYKFLVQKSDIILYHIHHFRKNILGRIKEPLNSITQMDCSDLDMISSRPVIRRHQGVEYNNDLTDPMVYNKHVGSIISLAENGDHKIALQLIKNSYNDIVNTKLYTELKTEDKLKIVKRSFSIFFYYIVLSHLTSSIDDHEIGLIKKNINTMLKMKIGEIHPLMILKSIELEYIVYKNDTNNIDIKLNVERLLSRFSKEYSLYTTKNLCLFSNKIGIVFPYNYEFIVEPLASFIFIKNKIRNL